jgi:hypothetical protein
MLRRLVAGMLFVAAAAAMFYSFWVSTRLTTGGDPDFGTGALFGCLAAALLVVGLELIEPGAFRQAVREDLREHRRRWPFKRARNQKRRDRADRQPLRRPRG